MLIRSVYTFIIYFFLFATSLFFIRLAESYIGRKNRKFIIFSVIALLIPILFAGFRGLEVGTDVESYAYPEFELCMRYGTLTNYLNHTTTNFGYALIVALSALVFKSFNIQLMLTEALQLIPVYIAAYRLKDRVYIHNVMLAFYLLEYIIGFNIMRQYIAVGLILLGYIEIISENKIRGVVCLAIAFLFHSTTIIGILFIADGLLIYSAKKTRIRNFWLVVTTVILFVIIIKWQEIILGAVYLGLLPADRMQIYMDIFTGNSNLKQYMFEISFSQYLEIIFKVIYLAIPFLFLNSKLSVKDKVEFIKKDKLIISALGMYLLSVVINVSFVFLFHSAYGYRVAVYGEYFLVILIPLIVGKRHNKQRNNSLVISKKELICYMIPLITFYILFMYFGQHETLPFYFQIY